MLRFVIARITMTSRGRVHEREACRASCSGISAGGPLLAHDTSLEYALSGAHVDMRWATQAHCFILHGQAAVIRRALEAGGYSPQNQQTHEHDG